MSPLKTGITLIILATFTSCTNGTNSPIEKNTNNYDIKSLTYKDIVGHWKSNKQPYILGGKYFIDILFKSNGKCFVKTITEKETFSINAYYTVEKSSFAISVASKNDGLSEKDFESTKTYYKIISFSKNKMLVLYKGKPMTLTRQ